MSSSGKFFLCTFGCRCNQADSAAIRAGLSDASLEEVRDHRGADLIVVNSCTVTHRTDQQVRQAVRKMHRENPRACMLVTGCYADRDPRALAAISGVNLVVGNAGKQSLAKILQTEDHQCSGKIIPAPDPARDYLLASGLKTAGKTRPFVKLQDGCDARCSYCIIPSVRGPGRSARPDEILREIAGLVERGYQEIVLTGVHLGAYGRKLESPANLVDLLERIVKIPGLGRLRLSSVEPMRFSRAIVRLAAANPVFAPHFHIPLQSGSDRILRRMRRPYTAARFIDLLDYVRAGLPTAGLGTDVLVGFPGETDADFEATCRLVRSSPLTYLHVFPFSARAGTDAYSMPHPVPPKVIYERARVLRQLSQEKNLAFRRGFLGRIIAAVTLAREEELGEGVALTENYIHARLPAALPSNRLINVRIERVDPEGTSAVPVHH